MGFTKFPNPNGNIWGINAFIKLITKYRQSNSNNLAKVLHCIQTVNGKGALDDDFSLLEITFS